MSPEQIERARGVEVALAAVQDAMRQHGMLRGTADLIITRARTNLALLEAEEELPATALQPAEPSTTCAR